MIRATALLLAVAVLAGCGGSEQDEEVFEGVPLEAQDAGPVHVHGLGVNPADGSLFVATHTGLFRVAPGQKQSERVGERRQDTMGFSVAGPNRFVGSGHPDARDDLPPLLGLIESRDAGRTWEPVSLLGEVDFHVLRSTGKHVYGLDSTSGRLLASTDRGKSWDERSTPEPLLDLVPHPSRPATLVAAGSVLYRSIDGGRSWSALGGEPGYLAWPSPERLYQVNAKGRIRFSRNGGETWRPLGTVGARPAALLAVSADELYVALHDGTIVVSRDGGTSWSIRSRP